MLYNKLSYEYCFILNKIKIIKKKNNKKKKKKKKKM